MLAQRGAALLEELRKTKWLPPYSDGGIRQVASEIKELLEPFLETLQTHRNDLQSPPYLSTIVLLFRAIQRNKRCALAYLLNRLRRIQTFRWCVGAADSSEIMENMSPQEMGFLNGYNRLLGEYSDAVNLDLTADIKPPRDLFIEVRVKRDCGSVMTESGVLNLRQGTMCFVKRTDVEHLIRQGKLEHIV